ALNIISTKCSIVLYKLRLSATLGLPCPKTVKHPDLAAGAIVSLGDPAAEITHYAEKNQVDLIMMPTHGYGRFRNMLLGSVTAKVLHDAHCPIWTAAHT